MAFLERSEGRAGGMDPEAASLRQTVGLLASLVEVEPPSDLRRRVAAGLAEVGELRPMDCAQVEQAVDPYLEGELDKTEERALHLHLAGCGRCRREVNRARAAIRLTSALAQVEPPVRVRERVAAQVASRTRPRRLRPSVRRVLVSVMPLAAAAALVLAVRTHVPAPVAPMPVASAPAATAERPAAPPTPAAAPATEPEAVESVAVSEIPSRPVARHRITVGGVIARIGDSLATAAAAAAGDARPSAGAAASALAAKEVAPAASKPDRTGSATETAWFASADAQLQEKLARLPTEETTPTPPEAAPAAKDTAELRVDLPSAARAAPVQEDRKTVNLARPTAAWPDPIRVERNLPRSVDLPLIRREY